MKKIIVVATRGFETRQKFSRKITLEDLRNPETRAIVMRQFSKKSVDQIRSNN